VDPAATEIAAARHATAALGLERVDWRPAGIEEPLPEGLFDYVIAHGVLSWIPPEAQDALWAVLAERTAPGAVVYLSFNTWPGWSTRGMVRDLMRFRTRGIAEPGARVRAAREVLAALAAETPATTLWGAILAAEKRVVDAVDDWYLFHDHLSDHNTPYWFEEVAARAAAAGLSYAGDAEPARSPCPSRALAAFADSSVALAQGGDFARMTMFREAVFVRGPARPGEPDPARVSGLSFWARARVESSAPLRIVTGGSTVTLTDPTAEVAYRALLAALPAAVPFGTLASVVPGDADHLAAVLLQLWLGSEAVGARRGGPSPVRAVTARPEVWSHARWQCARGEAPVNLRLDAAPIGPPRRPAGAVARRHPRPRRAGRRAGPTPSRRRTPHGAAPTCCGWAVGGPEPLSPGARRRMLRHVHPVHRRPPGRHRSPPPPRRPDRPRPARPAVLRAAAGAVPGRVPPQRRPARRDGRPAVEPDDPPVHR
jgi:SAM-dependent methyltransferase